MAKHKAKYALKGEDGAYYIRKGKLFETTSIAIAQGMRALAEKEQNQTYKIVYR